MPSRVQCHGCERWFSPRGLSQHIGKTQEVRCRDALMRSGKISSIQLKPLQPPLGSNHASPALRGRSHDTEYDHTGRDHSIDSEIAVIQDDILGSEDSSSDPPDPADVADANFYEALLRDTPSSPSCHSTVNDASADHDITELLNQTEAGDDADLAMCQGMSTPVVDKFPFGSPGMSIPNRHRAPSTYDSWQAASRDSPWTPFNSELEWDIAQWAKTHGLTSSAVSDLLEIPGIVDRLGLSFQTVKELNKIIDNEISGRPRFQRKDLRVNGELLEFHCRDVIDCIRCLYGDPRFAYHLAFAPERHYTSNERTKRMYNEMHTGNWWWKVQTALERRRPGATIVPLILSSDKTQLTSFRDKTAYPIYLTIGNIPKQMRRKLSNHAHILIGYIPTTKLVGISNKAARRRALANLFHACMREVLGPISSYGECGLEMASGDGVWRRCHPIFAIFVGDYQEQILVTCKYYGDCPKCTVLADDLGEYETFPPHIQNMILDIYDLADGDVHTFHLTCGEARMKPVHHPFWETLPLADVFLSITPDILHQMFQGMVRHMVSWLIGIYGAAAIDTRCRAIPPNHNILLFTKGLSTLSRISGHEHKKMCSFLLGLIVDLPVPGGQISPRVTRSVRALMDFLYLAQYECHTSDTISKLEDSLIRFHDNKEVFIDLGIRENFCLPKLHSLTHYASSIQLFGTTDNYNTEQTERLHIDLAKDAYRATNHKDVYPQMTMWLERREKIQHHSASIDWRQRQGDLCPSSRNHIGPPGACALTPKIARVPFKSRVLFDVLSRDYGALDFQDALADFIAQVNYPHASGAALRHRAHDTHIPFAGVPIYNNIKFTMSGEFEESKVVDVVHVRPEQQDSRGRIIPRRFDTVLCQGDKGRRIAQVRVVFKIPDNKIDDVFLSPDTRPSTHLAYVEWFTPIPATPDPNHLMYKVSRSIQGGRRNASIITVDSIVRSIHLLPRFGPVSPCGWNTFTVLDECQTFYINPFTDMHSYMTFA